MNRLKVIAMAVLLLLPACATNEWDAKIEEAYAKAVVESNKPKIYAEIDCPSGCTSTVYLPTDQITLERAKGNVEAATDGLVNLVTALTPYGLAREARKLTTDVATVIAGSAGDTITGSYNSEANVQTEAVDNTSSIVTTTETISGIKAGGDVDQSQHSPVTSTVTTPSTTTTTNTTNTDNSVTAPVTDSNNSTEVPVVPEEPEVPAPAPEV